MGGRKQELDGLGEACGTRPKHGKGKRAACSMGKVGPDFHSWQRKWHCSQWASVARLLLKPDAFASAAEVQHYPNGRV